MAESDIVVEVKLTPVQGGRLLVQKMALEKRVKELETVVKKLGDASDAACDKFNIIQPFLNIWIKHGELIAECRKRVADDR